MLLDLFSYNKLFSIKYKNDAIQGQVFEEHILFEIAFFTPPEIIKNNMDAIKQKRQRNFLSLKSLHTQF